MRSGAIDVVWTIVLFVIVAACAAAAMSRSCDPPAISQSERL
jgi:hypothetical protein